VPAGRREVVQNDVEDERDPPPEEEKEAARDVVAQPLVSLGVERRDRGGLLEVGRAGPSRARSKGVADSEEAVLPQRRAVGGGPDDWR
jgi:hypothetical protein